MTGEKREIALVRRVAASGKPAEKDFVPEGGRRGMAGHTGKSFQIPMGAGPA